MSSIKPLPVDFRYHLLELSGNELQVWMFYYLSTGDELTAHPSIETLAAYTGLSDRTIKVCKRRLVLKKWMAYTGDAKQPRSGHGHFEVPVMELRLPWSPEWKVVVAEVSLVFTAVQNLHHGEMAEIHGGANFSPPSVVQTLHPEGSGSGSGYGLPSHSVSASHTFSSSVSDSGVLSSKVGESKDERKARPEPEPTPVAPMVDGNGQGNGNGKAGVMVKKKPKACCKDCGEELKRDENHLLTCPVLNKKPPWYKYEDDFDEDEVTMRLDNWEELRPSMDNTCFKSLEAL